VTSRDKLFEVYYSHRRENISGERAVAEFATGTISDIAGNQSYGKPDIQPAYLLYSRFRLSPKTFLSGHWKPLPFKLRFRNPLTTLLNAMCRRRENWKMGQPLNLL